MRFSTHLLAVFAASLLVSSSASVADPPAAAAKSEKPRAVPAKLDLRDGDSIVFLGDSITHQCLYTQYVEDYFYTRHPKLRLKFHNSGVGGDRCSDALTRFDRDVAAYKPKYVTILLGMNDGAVKPYDEEVFQTYHQDMQALLDKITEIGATPILMTPTMFDSRASRAGARPRAPEALEFYNSTLAYYGAWLRELATERGLRFVDMYSPLNNLTLAERKRNPTFTLIKDGVHPDAPGQVIMAAALLNDLGVSRKVSSIGISRGDDKPTVKASGAKVTDVEFTSDGVQFNVAAESLPLALPAEAQVGVTLTALGHRLSQESLDVHGLEPGKYRLLIDDTDVGVYTTEQLERHIELQSNAKTPQFKQALAVAELNKARNAEAVHPLRDLWRSKKLLTFHQGRANELPDNASVKEQVATLEKQLADMDEQIEALEAKAGEIEDKIFASNTPPVRKYRLVRIP